MECDAAGGSGVVRYVPLGASSAASEPPERRAAAAPTRDDGRGVRGVVGDIITSIVAGGDDDAPGWGTTTDRGDGDGGQRGEGAGAGGRAPLPGATMNDGAGAGAGGGADVVGCGPTCWKCRGLGTTTAKRNKRKPRKENRGRCIHGEGAGQREGGDGVGGGGSDRESSSESKSSVVDGVVHEGAAVPADDAGTHTAADSPQPPRSPVSAAAHPVPVRLRCGVCDGRGRLPPKRSAEEAASQRQPGVITRPRRITHPGFVPFGPTPRAIVQLRRLRLLSKRQRRPQLRRLAGEDGYEDGEEGGGSGGEVFDPDIVKDWNVRALELLERAETLRTEVEVPVPPADEPSGQPPHSNAPPSSDPTPPPPRPAPARRPSWLPGPGEQLCNLVGQFRILQRVGSHRWTTDDLVTAHVASTEARRNFHSWRRAEEEEKDNGSDDDGGGGGPGAGDGCYRYLDLGCGNASVLLVTAWSLVQILGDGGGGGGGGRGAAAPDDGKDGEDSSAGAPVGVGVDDGRLEHVERMEMEMEKTGDREKNEEAVVRERRRRRMLCCTGVEARGEASRLARRSIEFNLGCIPSSSSTTPPSPPPPRSSSASPPPTSTFYEVPAPHGEGAGGTGTGGGGGDDGGSRVAVDVRAEVVHGDFRHLIAKNGDGSCGGGGEDDDRGRHSHGEGGGVVNAPAPPPHTDAHADMGSNEGEGESGNFGHGGRGRTMTMEEECEDRDENKRGDMLFHLITGTPPYFRVDFAVSSTTAANERDGATTTTTAAEPHSSSSSGGGKGLVVQNAVIRQGGMPTSLQSAPARCEFRGGIEEYCMAASCCLHPHLGVFVVCENWANRGRVHGGAALAGLVVVRVLPVRGKVGRPQPLFAVYVMRKREYFSTQKGGGDGEEGHVRNEEASIPEQPEVLPCLSVRDEGGRWTEEYGRVLDSLSIPAEAAVSGQF